MLKLEDAVPAGAVTCTVIVHVPGVVGVPAGIVPPVKLTVRGCVIETVPPQVVAAEPATMVRIVPGKVSETLTPVYGEFVGLSKVIVSVVVPPAGIVEGENAFVIPIASTFRRAVA